MGAIKRKQKLAENIYLMEILAPDIARSSKPGQFIILQIGKKGERIPLSIADFTKKTVTIVFSAVGFTTKMLAGMKKGQKILHVVGPLGNPTEIKEFGNVCLIGGGFGAAPLYAIAKAMKKAKNNVMTIIGARTKSLMFWEKELAKSSDELMVMTDDGSRGDEGFVTDALEKAMKKVRFNLVVAIGPPAMMKSVAKMTQNRVKTVVSLSPIMMDGMGMCGGCRVAVGGEVKFACVDGPEFDAHEVDWESLAKRGRAYEKEESHICRCGK
jgi:ferredoxin--NADP+ reductase